jgi:hypothetical protein
MRTQVYETTLKRANFGQWSWTGSERAGDLETLEDYEDYLSDPFGAGEPEQPWERTNELHGLIEDERGQVYKSGETYVMAWVEEE